MKINTQQLTALKQLNAALIEASNSGLLEVMDTHGYNATDFPEDVTKLVNKYVDSTTQL